MEERKGEGKEERRMGRGERRRKLVFQYYRDQKSLYVVYLKIEF